MGSTRTSLALQSLVVFSLCHITAASSSLSGLPVASTTDSRTASDSSQQSQSASAQQPQSDTTSIQPTPASHPGWDSITASLAHLPTTSTQDVASNSRLSLGNKATSGSLSHVRTVCVTLSYTEVVNTDVPSIEPSRTYISNTHTSNAYSFNANASDAYLSSTDASNAYLSNINASDTYLSSTDASNTYLSNINGSDAHLSNTNASSVYLSNANASDTYLSNTNASNTYRSNANTSNTYLSNANASNAYLSNADASNTYLSNTNASNTYLSNINASNAYLSNMNASDTYLSNTNASNTYLSNIDASNTYLSNIDASNTYLSNIDASDTYLSNTNASDTYLSNIPAFSAYGSGILARQTPMLSTHAGFIILCTTEEISAFPSETIVPSPTNTLSSGAQTTASTYTNSSSDATAAATQPSTTISTRLTTVPVPYSIAPNVSFPFQLKYDVEFNKDLEDPSTDYYQQAVVNYTNMIEPAYKNVTGFQNIIINKFWNGSVGVDYSVVIAYNLTDKEFMKEMKDIVYPVLDQSGVNKTFLRETFNKSIYRALDVLKDACETSSSFCTGDNLCMLDENKKPFCRPLCTNREAINKCQNGGRCVQDAPNNFICRCPEDTTFLYGGQYCEVKAEKLGLKKDYIIAIACGAGGGIILILLIIIIILCQRRRSSKHSKDDKDDASEQSFKSIKDSEDGLHQNLTGIRNSSLLDYSNPTFSLPEQRAENVQLYPRSVAGGSQKPMTHPLNPTISYGIDNRPGQIRPSGPEMEAAKPGVSHPLASSSRTSSGDQPGLYPNLRRIHPTADYVEIQDAGSKAFMYQPTKVMRPLTEFQGRPLHSPSDPKVYDYSNRNKSRANQESSGFYDFNYENSSERGSRMNDPYSIRRPHLGSQK